MTVCENIARPTSNQEQETGKESSVFLERRLEWDSKKQCVMDFIAPLVTASGRRGTSLIFSLPFIQDPSRTKCPASMNDLSWEVIRAITLGGKKCWEFHY